MQINKISILCPYEFPEGMAPTTRIVAYSKGFVQNGVTTEVICFFPKIEQDKNPDKGKISGIKYKYINRRRNVSKFTRHLYDRPKAIINTLRYIRKSNSEKKIDLILLSFDDPLWLIIFALPLWICRYKIAFIGDEYPEPIRKLKDNVPLRFIAGYKLAYHFIGYRILMTEALKKFYDEKVCIKPTCILSSIVDVDRFEGVIRKEVERDYLCYMGNMMLAKDNVDNIIQAFSLIKDAHPNVDLYLYGTPVEKDLSALTDIIQKLNIKNRVFIKGRVSYNEVAQILANAKVLVTSQPNTKRAEGGFPTKMAEYMMSHTPMLVTNVGEIHNYVTDNVNTFMVEPCNPVEYAAKLDFILSHNAEAMNIANQAYKDAVESFGPKNTTSRLIDFFFSQI